MPSPATPHRPSKRGSARQTPTSAKPIDIGEQLGPYDTTTVRDKVRKWQQKGGGVKIAADVGASSEESDKSSSGSKLKETPQSSVRKKPRRTRNTKDIQDHSDEKSQNSNTPKKRVVSDAHWRKKRSPPSTPARTKPTPRKRTEVVDRRSRSKDCLENGLGSPGRRTEAGKNGTKDGINVYPGPLRSAKRETESSNSEQSLPIDDGETAKFVRRKPSASGRRSPKKNLKPNYCVNDSQPRTYSPKVRGSSPEADKIELLERLNKPRHPKPKTPNRNVKPPKANIITQVMDESKKIFSSPEPTPVPNNTKGSRVEAWLSNTDPFVDGEEESVGATVPSKPPSPRREIEREEQTVQHNQKRSSPNRKSSGRKRHSKSSRKYHEDSETTEEADSSNKKNASPSRNTQSLSEAESLKSPPRLKRSKARKRLSGPPEATRMSMLTESVEEALQGSNSDRPISSDGSEVSPSDRPLPLTLRRPFPGTGRHRLSTIASVDTLDTSQGGNKRPDISTQSNLVSQPEEDAVSDSEMRDKFDMDSLPGPSHPLKRRLTKHADLMSVLSIPASGTSRSIRSARSIRTNRSRLATASVSDIMRELASDEIKYLRELRTLVGGVIPVLLTSILSKADSAIAAGLFRPSIKPDDDANFTQPIIDMGVSLERLKSLHKRMPLNNPDSLLNWALGAQKVYADYLAAWRLGFQGVIVNLAPPDTDDPKLSNSDAQSLCAGMEQDENGDVIDGDGERVDVAFLLKRPLVRLKYLAKTFKGLNYIQTSAKAEEVTSKYQSLVTDARRRANEERARLEDDAAASIDASKARDLQTLAVLKDATINKTRKVRARDYFDLSLLHSTGQQIDCRAELLLRDNAPENGPGGDLIICEIDETDRWILFPPIDCSRISARNGDEKGEIVIMIRPEPGKSKGWYELLSFTVADEQLGFEWVQLIGLNPVPPKINRSMSFVNRIKNKDKQSESRSSDLDIVSSTRAPSPTDVNVPIGEQATVLGSVSTMTDVEDSEISVTDIPCTPKPAKRETSSRPTTPQQRKEKSVSPRTKSKDLHIHTPKSLNEGTDMAGDPSPTSLKRSKAKRRSKYGPLSPSSPTSSGRETSERDTRQRSPPSDISGTLERRGRDITPTTPTRESSNTKGSNKKPTVLNPPVSPMASPMGRRSLSPVPSLELPLIPKLRKNSRNNPLPPSQEDSDGYSDGYSDVSSLPSQIYGRSRGKEDSNRVSKTDLSIPRDNQPVNTEDVPSPPPHRTPSPAAPLKQPESPVLSPPTPQYTRQRRTSSPLKHEYEPSTASESSPSETSSVERHEIYSGSDTSDEELEDDDIAAPLPRINSHRSNKKISPPSSGKSSPEETLGPSNSASQSPYKRVPSQPSKASKTIASLYFWHDKGSWQPLHLDECSVVVTPGLIEAYEMSSAHSQPIASDDEESSQSSNKSSRRPIIALELTPLVPIRRGTALDISIRSPPTERSKITASNNIMFRSRSPDECEKLYGHINQSRINNPTYIALQNARGPYSNQPAPLGRYNSTRSNKGGSWFSWYGGSSKNSYRASSAPTRSLAGATDSSVGTMSSAFSALKRFGAGSKMFSIARSTLTSRTGSQGGTSLYSTSTSAGSRPGSSGRYPGNAEASKIAAGGIGLTNAKIRLYSRESASKWRDMGAARLTILPASPSPSPPGTSSNTQPGFASDPASLNNTMDVTETSAAPPHPIPSAARDEKRILIQGKSNGEVLLDACLGESSFERVARTGIAVSVYEEFTDIAKEGGVVGGSFKIYMIQMKSEAETAYTFGLVGKLRY